MSFTDKYKKMSNIEKLVWHSTEHMQNWRENPERLAQGYYTETGRYKPWSVHTVRAAHKRGLIRIVEYLHDLKIFYVLPTDTGIKLGLELTKD